MIFLDILNYHYKNLILRFRFLFLQHKGSVVSKVVMAGSDKVRMVVNSKELAQEDKTTVNARMEVRSTEVVRMEIVPTDSRLTANALIDNHLVDSK